MREVGNAANGDEERKTWTLKVSAEQTSCAEKRLDAEWLVEQQRVVVVGDGVEEVGEVSGCGNVVDDDGDDLDEKPTVLGKEVSGREVDVGLISRGKEVVGRVDGSVVGSSNAGRVDERRECEGRDLEEAVEQGHLAGDDVVVERRRLVEDRRQRAGWGRSGDVGIGDEQRGRFARRRDVTGDIEREGDEQQGDGLYQHELGGRSAARRRAMMMLLRRRRRGGQAGCARKRWAHVPENRIDLMPCLT